MLVIKLTTATMQRAARLNPELHVVIQRPVAAAIDDADIHRWVGIALPDKSGELTVRIVDVGESAALNGQYRDKYHATNVLSFPADPPPAVLDGVDMPFGDLVLCAPVIAGEAVEQGKTLTAHWAHLIIHGCLHLRGFDHETAEEAATMEALERDLLTKLGFTDPYAIE